ncbi:MAG: DUF3471 domain-containing protein [Lacunisphaera sp.]
MAILANVQKPMEGFGSALFSGVSKSAEYPGLYPLAPSFAIKVTESGGSFFVQATGQSQFGLQRIAGDRFTVVGIPAEVSFERDAVGNVIALVLHQNGQHLRGPHQPLPPPVAEFTLPAEILREYAGTYPLAPQFALSVTESGDALFVQATGQQKLPVFASAKDEFFYKAVEARLSFQRDATGKWWASCCIRAAMTCRRRRPRNDPRRESLGSASVGLGVMGEVLLSTAGSPPAATSPVRSARALLHFQTEPSPTTSAAPLRSNSPGAVKPPLLSEGSSSAMA